MKICIKNACFFLSIFAPSSDLIICDVNTDTPGVDLGISVLKQCVKVI